MQLSNYVKTFATNEVMLSTSGFDMAGDVTPNHIHKAKEVRVKDGINNGEFTSKRTIVKGARGYSL